MKEADTRKDLIDQHLAAAGWNINDPTQVVLELDILTSTTEGVAENQAPYHTRQFSDYALLGRDHKPLAIIEAKKSSIDAAVGREQAKQYCIQVQKQRGGELPFCFYTNGHDIYFWDIGHAPPRKVIGYPTREDLERLAYIRRNKKHLTQELINTDIAGRDYQIRAIRAVLEGIENKRRNFLLVMATGTGKTRTCIALIDALMRAAHAVRVLFLVDRIALRDQALAAFKEHMPNEPRWPNPSEKAIVKDRRIYVATYQTMLNIIRDDVQQLSPHFFDFIVVDESHRSIYNTYGDVLNYFKTTTLGLTATPTDSIDHNTFQLFHCENGIPTFAYTFEEAVTNQPPYLSNFQVMKLLTKFQEQGISKRTISLEDQKKLIAEGQDIQEIDFEGTQLEKQVVNKGTNTLIVREFMDEAIKDDTGTLPGKTIFFCTTIKHARRIEEIFDTLYPEHNGELAKVIVSEDTRVHGKGGLLDQFTNNDMPRIAISVDMLDTGIDIREVVNLVFAKPVYSYTKFWQMIGRGTRLLEAKKPKPWCLRKDQFLILDCWDNFEYFKLTPQGKEFKPQVPLPVRLFGLRLDKVQHAIDTASHDIAQRETIKLRAQIDELPQASIDIKEASALLTQVMDPTFWPPETGDRIQFLRTHVKPLFSKVPIPDQKAMRFEKDLLEYSLAVMQEDKHRAQAIQDAIIEQVSSLPLSIAYVRQEEALIRQAQTPAFWAAATEDTFDLLQHRLGPLMKFRDPATPTTQIFLDLQDQIAKKDYVEFGPQHESVPVTRYREMVEDLIAQLTASNPILQKIKQGQAVTPEEAQQLAQVLQQEHPHITEALLQQVYKNRKARFLQFMRHILGIERIKSLPEEVSAAFDTFIQRHTNLTTAQLRFLDLIKKFIIDHERIQKMDLIQSPFTVIHPQGIRGLFTPSEIQEILKITQEFAA